MGGLKPAFKFEKRQANPILMLASVLVLILSFQNCGQVAYVPPTNSQVSNIDGSTGIGNTNPITTPVVTPTTRSTPTPVPTPVSSIIKISSTAPTAFNIKLATLVNGFAADSAGVAFDWGYDNGVGSYVEFTLDVAVAGYYQLVLNSSSIGSGGADISVNGVTQTSTILHATSNYTVYVDNVVKFNLPAGTGVKLRITANVSEPYNLAGLTVSPLSSMSALPACPQSPSAVGQTSGTFTCSCGAISYGAIWGTNIYTDDSDLCTAAAHAGFIISTGGPISYSVAPGEPSYLSSTQNGITSNEYGAWTGSYYFNPVK